ncbi:7894_t:CDS:2 [Paraglomus occultum]|uniref:7894_t:CDS:1 n=1 Tax=Paraglomus occultum TaxID=144539 RepID=A0A9N9AD64_9GLOM|nr:7894_t:CDS:2 [Paraglomus occultum]
MKFAHITILSLLVLTVCAVAKPRATIVDYVPAREVLPLPVSVETVDGKPGEYIVKSSLYGSGFENYSSVKTKLTCEPGVKVIQYPVTLSLDQIDSFRTNYRLQVPADKKIVTCVRNVTDSEGSRTISFSFNPTH